MFRGGGGCRRGSRGRGCMFANHTNLIRWLKDVVEGLGGTTPMVQIEVVREPNFKRVYISFQVLVRHIDFASMEPGEATPMVSNAAMDGVAPIWVLYERLVVEACL
ncbi:hypothetical protein PVAP13_8KG118601 [Panicum virgatum]|uniref:Uncharacterized protein n=1 Tax=Panicum virgatum TaxID=38727 RepID=A0A8T0PJX2_PANVG|nr:hypothetical protein PVAP13_8KG118601 [Panicum virgatum]